MTNPNHSNLYTTAHHSFVLRLWEVEDGHWHVMLLDTQTRKRYGFRDIAEAVVFIETFCRGAGQHG